MDSHGRALLEACQTAGLTVTTGLVPGDQPPQPSLRPTVRTQPTRPDHILASEEALPYIVEARVNQQQPGSDHWPLEAQLLLPWQPTARVPCTGTPIPRHIWQPAARQPYAEALDAHPALVASLAAAGAGDVETSLQQLHEAISSAATASGMPARAGQSGGPRRQHQPFFDEECQQLKRDVRRASSAERKQLERTYHSVVRRKARAYRAARLQALLADAPLQQRSFWRTLRRSSAQLPAALQNTQAWDAFVQRAADIRLPAGLHLPPAAYPSHDQPPAATLNQEISQSEVETALLRLHNGRAHGPAGLPAELLRYAQPQRQPDQPPSPHTLAPVLTAVFNAMFAAGSVPAAYNLSLVTPVHKRGDRRSTANYRPIAVADPTMRLYASILNQRLLDYTEQRGLRSPSQAGFRPGQSPVHQLFTLQHLGERQRQRKQPLFVCFLDLKGAFDRVSRDLLWQSLQRLGLHGRMLAAIRGLYSTATLAVRIQGRQGQAYDSVTGVKQGCPLSPTLFGLLADGLHRSLQHAAAASGVQLAPGLSVTDLGYADDFALASGTAAGLQALIDTTAAWCAAVGMQPSPEKTVVMEMTRAQQPQQQQQHLWRCGGAQLASVDQARYLGAHFQPGRGFLPTFSHLQQRMWASHYSLRKQYLGLDCGASVWLPLRLHAACVEPAGSFACELWGVYQQHGGERQRLETARLKQLRQLTGLRQSTALPIIYEELDLQPFQHVWLLRAAGFWNALAASRGFHKRVALDAVELTLRHRVHNWVHGLCRALAAVGYHLQLRIGDMTEISVSDLRSNLRTKLAEQWSGLAGCPRTCPSAGVRLCTYLQWFQRPHGCRADVLRLPLPRKTLVCLLRLRTGCHSLPNITGAWEGVPRSQRLCPLCGSAYADERHALLECPALAPVREEFPLLSFSGCMLQFMWQQAMVQLAAYVARCLKAFESEQ